MSLALEWDSIRGLIETVKVKMSKKSEEKEEDAEQQFFDETSFVSKIENSKSVIKTKQKIELSNIRL